MGKRLGGRKGTNNVRLFGYMSLLRCYLTCYNWCAERPALVCREGGGDHGGSHYCDYCIYTVFLRK